MGCCANVVRTASKAQFCNNGLADVVTIDAIVDSTCTHFAAFLGTMYAPVFPNNGPTYLGDRGW